MENGITSFSAYIPSLRIDRAAIAAAHSWSFPALKGRGKGARALANWDEDAITMGVEAARGLTLGSVGAMAFASTNPPFANLQNASMAAAALGLPANIFTSDIGGSLRAGTSALLGALRSTETLDQVVIAADARHAKPGSVQEMQYGAGAVAFSVGGKGVIAKLVASASSASQFIDHFRATGEKYDYYWEERWVRDEGYAKIVPPAVKAALEKAGVAAADIHHFCMPSILSGTAATIAKKVGVPPTAVADNLDANCGDTGAAHSLLMLASVLEKAKPGERILVVSFGEGCDVLLFQATDAIAGYKPRQSVTAALASGRVEPHYTKLLSFHGEIDLDWGMRSEGSDKIPLTQQYRARDQLATFTAGVCPACGAVQFPQLASCVNCGSFEPLKPRSLVNEPARVATYTADWLQYYPAPPLYFGLVQFDIGTRVLMEIVDVGATGLEVGTPLRMVYRVKSKDPERHFQRYFWKATPIKSQGA
jgi:3-hydroxy-3-methylglutaryl CoA synthase